MSVSIKSSAKQLRDLGCERGNKVNPPPILYVPPVDPNEKQEKTEIKLKLPDGTNYQMVPFHPGTSED